MTDTVTSQNIDLSSWDTLYRYNEGTKRFSQICTAPKINFI
jgi:hypothetical protein